MSKKKNQIKQVRKNQRSYLNKDFEALRSELTGYGKSFFSDKIQDFGTQGLAGMFIEMAAYIGDNMSFYMDHQFNELDIVTAVESQNIERLVRAAGVKIQGAAPSSVDVSFYIEIEAASVTVGGEASIIPNPDHCPIIKAGTILASSTGVKFELMEDLNFAAKSQAGKLLAEYSPMKTDSEGIATSFAMKLDGRCTSGLTLLETISIKDAFTPFLTITLNGPNISEVVSVRDSDGNEYYEVEALTQDTVFKRVVNDAYDSEHVSESIELIPAPYRFIKTTSRATGKTSLRFGGGDALSTDDDIMPDPSDLAIPLYGKRNTVSRFTLDPNALLQTRTLGIAPRNTSISIRYRSGGGLSHNVGSESIKTVSVLLTKFSSSVPSSKQASIRSSIECRNELPASGGESAPTINELKSTALAFRNSQSRIVTKPDLIARIYTMPAKFGRVFRCGVRDNPNNPLASVISIISRDTDGKLQISSDTLKENLKVYLNEYRLISDAYDIVDASVINVKIQYSVVVDAASNSALVLQNVNSQIKKYMAIENWQIDQPLMTSDIINLIINSPGVISLVTFEVLNISGTVDGRDYSNQSFSVTANTDRGMIIPPLGSVLEVKFPEDDIIGIAR